MKKEHAWIATLSVVILSLLGAIALMNWGSAELGPKSREPDPVVKAPPVEGSLEVSQASERPVEREPLEGGDGAAVAEATGEKDQAEAQTAEHKPTRAELLDHMTALGIARKHGLDFPRRLRGTDKLWNDLEEVSNLYRRELVKKGGAAFDIASDLAMKMDTSSMERVDPKTRPSLRFPGERTVMVGNQSGVHVARFVAGANPELDAAEAELRFVETSFLDAYMFVLRFHKVIE